MFRSRIKALDLRDLESAQKVLNLQKRSYVIEASIIGFYDIPPLRESVSTIQACGENGVGAYLENDLVGCASFVINVSSIVICRLCVAPEHFRKGIASAMLKWILDQSNNVAFARSSTAVGNVPACDFYRKHGFTLVFTRAVQEGIEIAEFSKRLILQNSVPK